MTYFGTCSRTKSWFGFHPPSGLLEGHTDWRQALAQGKVEGPASAARTITDQIASNLVLVPKPHGGTCTVIYRINSLNATENLTHPHNAIQWY